MVARGEVWWYEPPDVGRRPVLVLTRNEAVSRLNQLIAVPATRTIRGIPTEVKLDSGDGMPHLCVLTLDNLQLIRTAYCTKRITRLGPEKMHAVCEALKITVAC